MNEGEGKGKRTSEGENLWNGKDRVERGGEEGD